MPTTRVMMPVDAPWRRGAGRIALGLMLTGAGTVAVAAEPQYDFTATSSTITILFDDEGALAGITTGKNASISGMPVPQTAIADATPAVNAGQTPQFSVSAKEGMAIQLAAKVPGSSALAGGFTVDYGDAILTGERLDMNQSSFPGTAIDVLEHGALFGGPNALNPGRVTFDSSKSTLPRFSFRGVVQAAQVNMDRKEIAPAAPAGATRAAPTVADAPGARPRTAHYHVTMTDVGDFSGNLRSKQGWAYYTGWCDHAEADLAAEVTPKGLAAMRLEQVVLYGSQTPDGHTRRPAEVHRPQQAPAATSATTAAPASR